MSTIGLSDSKQKQTQQSATTASYGWQQNPGSADIDTLRNQKFQVDPTIGYRLGEQQRQLNNSLSNPAGGYSTPQIRDAIQRSQQRELMQTGGEQTREGQNDVSKLNYAKNAMVAGATAPVLTNTGGTSTGSGTVTQSQSPLGTAVQVAGAAAPLSM